MTQQYSHYDIDKNTILHIFDSFHRQHLNEEFSVNQVLSFFVLSSTLQFVLFTDSAFYAQIAFYIFLPKTNNLFDGRLVRSYVILLSRKGVCNTNKNY